MVKGDCKSWGITCDALEAQVALIVPRYAHTVHAEVVGASLRAGVGRLEPAARVALETVAVRTRICNVTSS